MGNAVNSPYSFKGYSYGKPSLVWFINTNGVNLNGFSETVRKAVRAYLSQEAAPDILKYMQNHHGWQNRTYTAEKGLVCELATEGNMKKEDYFATLQMYHTARHNGYEYGLFLESRDDLGVFKDTLQLYTPVVIEGMKGILDKYS